MAGRDNRVSLSSARARQALLVLGGEIRTARLSSGLSLAVVGGRLGMSPSKLSRIERGLAVHVSVTDLSQVAVAAGLDLSLRLYPGPRPIRDEGHRRLLARFRAGLHPALEWRTEVPLPIAGDRRAWDALVTGPSFRVAVEAETRLMDIQAVERRVNLKRRDAGMDRVLLLVANTKLNRGALRAAGPLADFPIAAHVALEALRSGRDPGGSAAVVL